MESKPVNELLQHQKCPFRNVLASDPYQSERIFFTGYRPQFWFKLKLEKGIQLPK